jgi:hypothetical protein
LGRGRITCGVREKLARPAGNIAAVGARKMAEPGQKPRLFPLFSTFFGISKVKALQWRSA